MDLRQSTAGQVITIGHALDDTDGNTEEDALTIANTDIKLHKHNTTVLVNKNSGGATNISNGVYHLTLDATDSSLAGRLVVYIHVAGALAMKAEFNVLTQSAFDAKYTGIFNNLGGVAQTADNEVRLSAVDGNVDAIKVTTDKFVFTVDNQVDSNALTQTQGYPSNFASMLISVTGDVSSDVNKINSTIVIGTGQTSDLWRA